MSETDAAEAKRRAEWLHKHKAHKDWIILTNNEISIIRAELEDAERERDEAREQNAKLREIAEWFANHFVDECWHLPHEDNEVHDKSVLSRCPVIQKADQLRAELDQLKEDGK